MNIWSKYEREKRQKRAAEERYDAILRNNPSGRRMTPDEIACAAERAEDEGRRYAVLLLTVRRVHQDWSLDAVLVEARRLLQLERPNHAQSIDLSYIPKAAK